MRVSRGFPDGRLRQGDVPNSARAGRGLRSRGDEHDEIPSRPDQPGAQRLGGGHEVRASCDGAAAVTAAVIRRRSTRSATASCCRATGTATGRQHPGTIRYSTLPLASYRTHCTSPSGPLLDQHRATALEQQVGNPVRKLDGGIETRRAVLRWMNRYNTTRLHTVKRLSTCTPPDGRWPVLTAQHWIRTRTKALLLHRIRSGRVSRSVEVRCTCRPPVPSVGGLVGRRSRSCRPSYRPSSSSVA